MAHLSQISNRQLLERSKFADCIAAADEYLRFIDGHPVGNPIRQCIDYNFCVVNEPIRRFRIQPAAFLVQGIRIIPVEQGNHWSNTSFQQSIDQIRIELNALLVDSTRPIRQNTSPADGEPIVFDAHFLHHLDIFPESVVMVAGNVSVFTMCNVTAFLTISVPDIFAFSVFEISSLYLIGCRRCTPQKIV